MPKHISLLLKMYEVTNLFMVHIYKKLLFKAFIQTFGSDLFF